MLYLRLVIICFGILSSALVFAYNDDRSFEEIMQQKTFQVEVSKSNLTTAREASTLLISCVDFSLRDETEKLMRVHLKLLDDYDEMVLPGASLAIANSRYPEWSKTAKDVISMLRSLHHIKRVIFLDHRGCSAYNMLLGRNNLDTREKESASHARVLADAAQLVKREFPDLEVYSLLMGPDGLVENMTPTILHK